MKQAILAFVYVSLSTLLVPIYVIASPSVIIDHRLPAPERHFYYTLRCTVDDISGELQQKKEFYITLNGKKLRPLLEVSVYEYIVRTDKSALVTLIVPDNRFYQLMEIDKHPHKHRLLGLREKQ